MNTDIEQDRPSRSSARGGAAWTYRMKDLCALTGLPRQAIHFYIQQGLVPEGRKTGPNMAYYGDSHVERITLIRQLQHERFLPLKAIRAMLEERDDAFSPAQRRLLVEVKDRLRGKLAARAGKRPTVDAAAVLAKAGLDRQDLDEMVEIGLLSVSPGPRGRTLLAEDDAWMLELWGEVRALGFSRALGFPATILAAFEAPISALFETEISLFKDRLSHISADRLATMVERVLPIVGTFLARYHATKARNFFALL